MILWSVFYFFANCKGIQISFYFVVNFFYRDKTLRSSIIVTL